VLNKALAIDKTGFTNNFSHLFYLNASICMEILFTSEHNFQRHRISLCDTYQTWKHSHLLPLNL